VIPEGFNRIGEAMSAITAKVCVVGGHERSRGRVFDVWNGVPTAENDRPVVVKGNRCMPSEVTRSRDLEPSGFDALSRART
jgi:hypothetical protein